MLLTTQEKIKNRILVFEKIIKFANVLERLPDVFNIEKHEIAELLKEL
jgi:hypothetical protein